MTVEPSRSAPTRLTDPAAVAAISHPLRMRLLGELSRRGSARVADLASAVGEPANSVSFHLRQLARFGLIERDLQHARDGRERWWRQTSDQGFEIDLDGMRLLEGGSAAVETLRRIGEGHVLALHRAIQQRSTPGEHVPSQAGTISDDFALRLSPAEFEQLRCELNDLFDRWGRTSRDGGLGDDGVDRHAYYGVVMAAPESDIFSIYNAQREEPT